MSIFHKRLIDVHFDLAFYKGMLGQEITLTDLKEIDPVLYKSLTYVLFVFGTFSARKDEKKRKKKRKKKTDVVCGLAFPLCSLPC